MKYLYGDSTPSPLRTNFIEFLRHALDFSVYVLSSEQRIVSVNEKKLVLEHAAKLEVERLEALRDTVLHVIEHEAKAADEGSPVARCAALIARGTTESVVTEVNSIRATLAAETMHTEVDAVHERDGCLKALEALLLRHDLPQSKNTVYVELAGGAGYAARLHAATPYGVKSMIALEIPAASPFAGEVRVDRFVEGLEILAPESGGWIRKEVKIAPHRLGKYHVAAISVGETETGLKLRVVPDLAASGFDLLIRAEAPRVVMSKVGKEEDAAGPFDVAEADVSKLFELCARAVAAADELSHNRKSLLEATFDGTSLREHERPADLIERLIDAIAPVVREIADHSSSPNELVLRRMVGEDRREEIFVAKAALAQKLEPLRPDHRALFAELGLDAPMSERGAGAHASPSPPPASTRSPSAARSPSPIHQPVLMHSPPDGSAVDDQWTSSPAIQTASPVIVVGDSPAATEPDEPANSNKGT